MRPGCPSAPSACRKTAAVACHRYGTGLSPDEITVVYGHGGEQVRDLLAADDLDWCEEIQRLEPVML